ncbi:hypothetical protein CUR178_01385 [Leishmania enriettii]|uniref:Gamma-soluble NSF attachment protein n=1 Tax=Leishmania enriettii TaxID=5663 RepID=A0A836H222_LEIEN|nr:hypothetical protein CUR178_01385 [Leishmania enriettii]
MQSQPSKDAEAEDYMKSGKKHLEKRLFHFRADYDSAAEDFDKAARIYASLSNYPKAREAWTQASGAHSKAHNDFNAANSMEKLGDFVSQYILEPQRTVSSSSTASTIPMLELDLFQNALHAYEEASKLYGVAANASKQAAALKKAADLISRSLMTAQYCHPGSDRVTKADMSYLRKEYRRIVPELIELMERNWEATESKPFDLPDIYRSYMLFCLRSGDVEGAVQIQKRMIGIVSTSPADGTYDDSKNLFRILNQPTNAAKAGLEIIVLCLSTSADDGYTWANIEMSRLGAVFGFCSSSEERAAAALLAAYAERDEDALQEALKKNSCFNFLAADVSRLAKKLTLEPQGRSKAAEAPVATAGGAASSAAPPPSSQAPLDVSEADSDDLR